MLKFDPQKHHRHPTRLKGFDYSSQGAYAITICTETRGPYLADPIDTNVRKAETKFLSYASSVPHLSSGLAPHLGRGGMENSENAQTRTMQSRPSPRSPHFSGEHSLSWCLCGPYLADPICQRFVETAWNALPKHFSTVSQDIIAIMPNHIHFIIWLHPTNEKKPQVGDIVRIFKGDFSRAWIRHILKNEGIKPESIWQNRFYDHIIRNEHDLAMQRRYILDNPEKHRHQNESHE